MGEADPTQGSPQQYPRQEPNSPPKTRKTPPIDPEALQNPVQFASGTADADLSRVIVAWPDLPGHIKAAVLALIGTAG